MCFAAMYWANVRSCVYAATSTDAAVVGGFDDAFIYEEIAKGEADRRVAFGRVDVGEQRLAPFRAFHAHAAAAAAAAATSTAQQQTQQRAGADAAAVPSAAPTDASGAASGGGGDGSGGGAATAGGAGSA